MLDFGRSAAGFGSDLVNQRRAFFQVIVVFQGQVFVASLGCGDRVGVFEVFKRVEALDGKRLGANAGDLFIDINVKALDQ